MITPKARIRANRTGTHTRIVRKEQQPETLYMSLIVLGLLVLLTWIIILLRGDGSLFS